MNNDDGRRGRQSGFIRAVDEPTEEDRHMHPTQSGRLFGQRGRVIVDEVEAHGIMSHAYSLDAASMTAAARTHQAMTHRSSGIEQPSTIRSFADLLHRAGTMDPNTQMVSHLTDLSGNVALRNRHYANGGGFTAYEKITRTPPTKKNPDGGTTTGQRNIEFHPPGGLHTGGNYTDTHGSYLRPATQLNQKKSLLRSFSSGALTDLNKKK